MNAGQAIETHAVATIERGVAPERSRDLDVAIEAAREAGALIRDAYRLTHRLGFKGAGDIVTQVDTDADVKIHDYLRRMFPGDLIVSEELAPGAVAAGGRRWYVDPLDASSAFVFRTDPRHPSVMLALEDDRGLAVSVIYFPLTDECFHAERGKGAYLNGERLSLDPALSGIREHRVVMNHYGDAGYETREFAALRSSLRRPGGAALVTIEAPHSGAACRVFEPLSTLVAVVHDNSIAKPKQERWDIAAPKLFVEEAGGVFWNLRGEPYPIGTDGPILIARTAAIGREILARLEVDLAAVA